MNRFFKVITGTAVAFLIFAVMTFLGGQFIENGDETMVATITYIQVVTIFSNCYMIWLLWQFYGSRQELSEVVHGGPEKLSRPLRLLGIGVLGWITMVVLNIGLHMVLPIQEVHNPANEIADKLSGPALLIFALGAAIAAPILEEILFRGFIFNIVRHLVGKISASRAGQAIAAVTAVIVSSALFAAAHGSATAFPGLFLMGVVMAEVYRRTNNIYASIAVHMVNNTVAMIVIALA